MTRIKQCCDYAHDAGRPYSEAQKLSKAHALVFNTGLFFETLDKWDELPVANQTYPHLILHVHHASAKPPTQQENNKTTWL
jgi:hypothetical protein